MNRIIPPSARAVPETLLRQQEQRDYHEHEDPFEPYPEGVVVTPDACWDQHPEATRIQKYYQPSRQWGDRRLLVFKDQQFGGTTVEQTQQLLDFRYEQPTVIALRLSCVELTGRLTTASSAFVATWTVDVGCGRALQIKQYTQQVSPNSGAGSTDLFLTFPAHAIRASCSVSCTSNVGEFDIECVCGVAPYTSLPTMVSR
jgi:hypothetical protein